MRFISSDDEISVGEGAGKGERKPPWKKKTSACPQGGGRGGFQRMRIRA